MRFAAFVASLSLLLVAAPCAEVAAADWGNGPPPPPPGTITVIGHALASRPPDVAFVDAQIVTSDASSAAHAAAANDVIEDRIANELAKLHLPGTAGHTLSYRSTYIAPPTSPDPHEAYGYVVTRSIEVRITPSQIDETTSALMRAGVASIDDVRTDLADRDAIYRDLYREALDDARHQAETIATAARVKIVRIRSVDASDAGGFRPFFSIGIRAAALPPPNSNVASSLTVTYEVAPFPMPGYLRPPTMRERR